MSNPSPKLEYKEMIKGKQDKLDGLYSQLKDFPCLNSILEFGTEIATLEEELTTLTRLYEV